MTDFIAVYDDALPPHVCEALVAAFEASPHAGRGVAGHRVDPTKKDSLDLTISQWPELAGLCAEVVESTLVHLERYFDTYSFAWLHLDPDAVRAALPPSPSLERAHEIGPRTAPPSPAAPAPTAAPEQRRLSS